MGIPLLSPYYKYYLFFKMEKFKGKESALMSYILRKKIFMSENDAYQQKTQQLHQELICEFAKLYNIKWLHKESFNIGWNISM